MYHTHHLYLFNKNDEQAKHVTRITWEEQQQDQGQTELHRNHALKTSFNCEKLKGVKTPCQQRNLPTEEAATCSGKEIPHLQGVNVWNETLAEF